MNACQIDSEPERSAPMRTAHFKIMQRACAVALTAAVFACPTKGWNSQEPTEAIQRGRTFLVKLFDPDLGLLSEHKNANVYWLFHDNYLAAKVLATSNPETARSITAAIRREDISKSGKIELIFGEAEKPLPFRHYQFVDVRHVGNRVIRTEIVTDRVLAGWQEYADLLLLACIAETNRPLGREHWDAAMRLWDGKGFLDAAARHDQRYSTYKLGLALLAACHLKPPAKPPPGLVDRMLALQDESGGWITDYDANGKAIGVANVETTCLCILGLEALRQAPAK